MHVLVSEPWKGVGWESVWKLKKFKLKQKNKTKKNYRKWRGVILIPLPGHNYYYIILYQKIF